MLRARPAERGASTPAVKGGLILGGPAHPHSSSRENRRRMRFGAPFVRHPPPSPRRSDGRKSPEAVALRPFREADEADAVRRLRRDRGGS
jgi:hypothetical protein